MTLFQARLNYLEVLNQSGHTYDEELQDYVCTVEDSLDKCWEVYGFWVQHYQRKWNEELRMLDIDYRRLNINYAEIKDAYEAKFL